MFHEETGRDRGCCVVVCQVTFENCSVLGCISVSCVIRLSCVWECSTLSTMMSLRVVRLRDAVVTVFPCETLLAGGGNAWQVMSTRYHFLGSL